MADVYPYTASSTTIRTLLPDWVLKVASGPCWAGSAIPPRACASGRTWPRDPSWPGLEWSDIMIASAPSHPEIEGLRLDEIARSWGKDPVEVAFDVIESEKGGATSFSSSSTSRSSPRAGPPARHDRL